MKIRLRQVVAFVLCAAFLGACPPARDQIRIEGAGSEARVALFKGNALFEKWATSATRLRLANRTGSHRLIALAPGRRPVFRDLELTDSSDEIAVEFQDPPLLRLSVHLLCRDRDDRKERALAALEWAQNILKSQRVGVRLSWTIDDSVQALSHGDTLGTVVMLDAPDLLEAFERVDAEVSVFYVRRVRAMNGSDTLEGTDVGFASATTDVICLGKDSEPDLLAHEIGHLFGLNHVDGSGLDERNVMISRSELREFFTAGQIVDSHCYDESVLFDIPDFAATASSDPSSPVFFPPPPPLYEYVWPVPPVSGATGPPAPRPASGDAPPPVPIPLFEAARTLIRSDCVLYLQSGKLPRRAWDLALGKETDDGELSRFDTYLEKRDPKALRRARKWRRDVVVRPDRSRLIRMR